jgi:hypothetical protein
MRTAITRCQTTGTIDDPIDGRLGGSIDDPIDGHLGGTIDDPIDGRRHSTYIQEYAWQLTCFCRSEIQILLARAKEGLIGEINL